MSTGWRGQDGIFSEEVGRTWSWPTQRSVSQAEAAAGRKAKLCCRDRLNDRQRARTPEECHCRQRERQERPRSLGCTAEELTQQMGQGLQPWKGLWARMPLARIGGSCHPGWHLWLTVPHSVLWTSHLLSFSRSGILVNSRHREGVYVTSPQ